MAIFKVGQRVRRARDGGGIVPVGAVGTITGARFITRLGSAAYPVRWDGIKVNEVGWYEWTLEPLTDPKADEFIERIKKLKPYDEPTVPARGITMAELVDNAMRVIREN